MENYEIEEEPGLTCSPTVHDVIEARPKTRTGVGCTPGQCAICGHKFEHTHIESGMFRMEKYYCARALKFVEESSRIMEREEEGERSKWKRECPGLYRQIKPAYRQDFPRIDWPKYDRCMKWDPKAQRGLVMVGESGSGKSTTLWHLMLRLEREGIGWSVYDGQKLSEAYFKAVRAGKVDELLQMMLKRPVLALEDFGKSVITEGTGAFIFDLINKRTENLMPIVMSTRFDGDTLPGRFVDDHTKGGDIVRRLNDYCEIAPFFLEGKVPK